MSQQPLYVVTVTYWKPLDVFVSGVFYEEAIIHRRLAREKGYSDATIWDEASFKKEKAAQRSGGRVESTPGTRDKLLHVVRSFTNESVARQASGL